MEQKTKIQTNLFREPYYKVSDGISQLESVVKKDEYLKFMVLHMKATLDEIYNHLEDNYLWD